MRKLNLSVKLIGGFLVMGLIVSLGGILGSLGISRMGDQLREVSEVHFPAVQSLGTLIECQKNIQRVKYSFLIPESFGDESAKGGLFKVLEEAWNQADKGWKCYEALPKTREEEDLWNNLKPAWEAWRKTNHEFVQFLKEGMRTEALALAAGKEKDAFSQAESLLLELSTLNLKFGEEAKKTGQAMAIQQKRVVLIGTAMGVMMALIFGLLFSRSFTRPVRRTIYNLSRTYSQFMASADEIASASHQLANGTSSQAGAVEKASSITEELATIVQRNSEDVQRLKQASDESAVVGFAAFELFRKAKKSTKEIKLSSEETSKIVKTIGEIAFQSNMLALSASVEAARTSEVGIGFSVVAEEVRNLGMRSTEAARNTTVLIEETYKLITKGDDLVKASLGSFIAYGEGSTPITGFTVTALDVAQKQALGIEQINTALGEISRTAQENAISARESASVAEQINVHAQNMARIVEELKRVAGDRG
ncbi:MAG: hypothetical protein FP816_17695 [Desulfobacteraceae bacterium]|nr:hypothetical protein [Desulfobacteraceae bacterium]MBU4054987.1 MCP four helix bundle domain-containing protein [Pseudomonadota bacterium]